MSLIEGTMFITFCLVLAVLKQARSLDDCSIGYGSNSNTSKSTFDEYVTKLSDYSNNIPKEHEIVRTTVFYNAKYPRFEFANNGRTIYFGNVKVREYLTK